LTIFLELHKKSNKIAKKAKKKPSKNHSVSLCIFGGQPKALESLFARLLPTDFIKLVTKKPPMTHFMSK
jgi:hypothetical protein